MWERGKGQKTQANKKRPKKITTNYVTGAVRKLHIH